MTTTPNQQKVNNMAKPTKFAHVVYSTRRFDEMIDWYHKVFEAKVVYQNPALAFLTYDDEHHRFAFINMSAFKPIDGNVAERGDTGVNHVAYTYASIGDLLDTYARLKQAGITPYWPVHHGVTLSLYYQDPDGNRMEFQVDCCSVEDANAYMLSDAFAANPIGVEIDPEALLEKYRSGSPAEKLLIQPEGPASQIPREHGL
jgi:catechol-2,3-dioxygenase